MTTRDPRIDAAVKRTFDAFAPSHRREYVEWITEAKRPDTHARRRAQTIGQLAEGKRCTGSTLRAERCRDSANRNPPTSA